MRPLKKFKVEIFDMQNKLIESYDDIIAIGKKTACDKALSLRYNKMQECSARATELKII